MFYYFIAGHPVAGGQVKYQYGEFYSSGATKIC